MRNSLLGAAFWCLVQAPGNKPLSFPSNIVHSDKVSTNGAGLEIAHLGQVDGNPEGFEAIRNKFVARYPAYELAFHQQTTLLKPVEAPRVLFVQEGMGHGTVRSGGLSESSALTMGDVVLLRAGQSLELSAAFSLLSFGLPKEHGFPEAFPAFLRPDWDPQITDTPGGCATETGAYRRILLTWLEQNGPYVSHVLNAHRVRIENSFSHYHPQEGGFDEFYLVQGVQPGAMLITSNQVSSIEDPKTIAKEQLPTLLQIQPLMTGDLVYLPRGIMHRGLGGVLAQVIAVPGFRPGAELGLDHHLRAINERFALVEEERLPLNEEASAKAVFR